MSKAIYLGGSSGTARKVKSLYIGVNGVARKVKAGYIGVNGVARLFYMSGITVNIIQSDHQTITVTCNGVNYTSSFTAPEGSEWTATIESTGMYKAGTLSAESGTVSGDTTISATEAILVNSVAYWLVVDRDRIEEVNDDNLL